MICPVRTVESQRWQRMIRWIGNDFRYDGDESSRWNERCPQAR